MAKPVVSKDINKKGILGTFTGKCCDSNVFNNNDMHLSRELFEKLMASDEYKRAMENRHYVGYLGHPSDPDCQDDQNACIVMTDMRILDNGEIEGDFDLIDTPVGRIVKAFTDGGVKYGLSIRGLGDVDAAGEVDPEEFIFRGFDLVRFPAYDDCIPTFKAIAASTDKKKKATYKKVCAAIDSNLPSITDMATLEFIQEPLVEGSDEFNKIQQRIDELSCNNSSDADECNCDLLKDQLNAVTELYIESMNKIRQLESALADCQAAKLDISVECSSAKAKYSHMKRIVAGQLATAKETSQKVLANNNRLNTQIKASNRKLHKAESDLNASKTELNKIKSSYDAIVTANTRLSSRLSSIIEEKNKINEAVEAANNMNLKYKHKIEATHNVLSQKDSAIEDAKRELHETVVANAELRSKASNLDDENRELRSRVEAAEEMVLSYQQAYANIYANALGVYLKDMPVTASTSVDELKKMISAATATSGIPAAPSIGVDDDELVDIEDSDIIDEDGMFEGNYNAGLVTL